MPKCAYLSFNYQRLIKPEFSRLFGPYLHKFEMKWIKTQKNRTESASIKKVRTEAGSHLIQHLVYLYVILVLFPDKLRLGYADGLCGFPGGAVFAHGQGGILLLAWDGVRTQCASGEVLGGQPGAIGWRSGMVPQQRN